MHFMISYQLKTLKNKTDKVTKMFLKCQHLLIQYVVVLPIFLWSFVRPIGLFTHHNIIVYILTFDIYNCTI